MRTELDQSGMFDRRKFLKRAGGAIAIGALSLAGLGDSECDYPYQDNLPKEFSKNPSDYNYLISVAVDVGDGHNVFLYSNDQPSLVLREDGKFLLDAKNVYVPNQNYLYREALALDRAYLSEFKIATSESISVRLIEHTSQSK